VPGPPGRRESLRLGYNDLYGGFEEPWNIGSGSAEEPRILWRCFQGCVVTPQGQLNCYLPLSNPTIATPLAAYADEASSSSRAYATACSSVIALPSAHAASNACGSSIPRVITRSRSFKFRKTDYQTPAPIFSLRASAVTKRRGG
jgi:hypothetical protein